ncbi:hypothetical protein QCA50_001449 [Cerrena zonata]|uniref:Uncharacterized protein n=1 Tax=Cerrena zonata TaxID=2478898 RepID=A0AAW0GX96_9APHY
MPTNTCIAMMRSSQTPSPSLNWDILLCITRCLDNRTDVSRMMRTHRVLYRAGWSVLLGFPIEVCRRNYHDILTMLSLPDAINRGEHIRSLSIDLKFCTDNDILGMKAIVEHSTNLRRLAIEPEDGENVFSNNELAEAVLWIQRSNQHLHLHDVLQRIKAPLAVLKISPSHVDAELKALIASFSATLEVIRTMSVQIRDLDFQCPRVHLLSLHLLRPVGFISTRELTAAFPNLKKLYFGGSLTTSIDEAEEYRARNQKQPAPSPWPKLDYVEISPVNLWILALQCPIHCLNILDCEEDDDPLDLEESETCEMIEQLNRAYNPVAMEACLWFRDEDQLEHLERLFEGGLSCQQFRVTIDFSGDRELNEFWSRILETWTRLPSSYLELDITSASSMGGMVYEEWTLCGGPGMDQMAEDLFTEIPALHQVYIHFGNSKGDEGLWEVMRGQTLVLRDLPLSDRPMTWIIDE